jgi:hypothetical protein
MIRAWTHREIVPHADPQDRSSVPRNRTAWVHARVHGDAGRGAAKDVVARSAEVVTRVDGRSGRRRRGVRVVRQCGCSESSVSYALCGRWEWSAAMM